MKHDKEVEEFAKRVVDGCGKQIEDSSVFCSLLTPNYHKDPVSTLQLGIAVLLDKPIFLMVFDDEKIPASLAKIAVGSFRIRSDERYREADMKEATKAMSEILTARGL